jgi:hypothetical protein
LERPFLLGAASGIADIAEFSGCADAGVFDTTPSVKALI